ncbi:hypothetical protein ACFQY5_39940 [Paeniroseomonas aquatica]|uniref:DUF4134 domain-containing protein n=1 Tax=Paeniroseomonas aquatica TaxID=373043 RepID=A0ABT8A050_9PROT|nr:hypothetical protein [Paeniroseomonas aquatica]MDN3563097.1 hypothetical protein [Paeniroseomonas aquatica]
MRIRKLAAAALLATTALGSAAQAQGIFEQMGRAGTSAGNAADLIVPAIAYGLGAFLLIVGGWNIYKHFRRDGRQEGGLGLAAGAFIGGFLILGMSAWAGLGTNTMTAAAPSVKNGTTALRF